MANSSSPNTVKEDHVVSPSDSPSDLRSLIASHTKNHKDIASERRIRLNSLYRKDAPRDHFTPTSASSKTPGASGAHSLAQRTCSMNESPVESTDSEKAVKGSDSELPDDGRVMFQGAMVKELAGHIPKNSSDELYLSGEEAEAIINGADRAFSDSSGNNFDGETFNDTCNSPFRASNLEEAKAMVEALERAQGVMQIAI